MKRLFQTDNAWAAFVLRLMLGVVIFPHGAQKLFGWFGGFGFSGTMEFFTGGMHIPMLVAFLVIVAESLGSLALIAGFLTRITSLGLLMIMMGAIWMVHWPNGFFMNWFGKQAGEGFEFHILVISISIALMIAGSGKWSIDRIIAAKLNG